MHRMGDSSSGSNRPGSGSRVQLRAGSRRRDSTPIGATLLLGGLVWLAVGASPLPGLVLACAGAVTILRPLVAAPDRQSASRSTAIQVALARAQSSPSTSKMAVPTCLRLRADPPANDRTGISRANASIEMRLHLAEEHRLSPSDTAKKPGHRARPSGSAPPPCRRRHRANPPGATAPPRDRCRAGRENSQAVATASLRAANETFRERVIESGRSAGTPRRHRRIAAPRARRE